MLSEIELTRLARDLESAHVERMESLSDKSAVEEAICAFSNDLPGSGHVGVVLIGVKDKTGEPAGLHGTDQLLLTLTSIRSDGNILPFPVMHVYKAAIEGGEVAAWGWRHRRAPGGGASVSGGVCRVGGADLAAGGVRGACNGP